MALLVALAAVAALCWPVLAARPALADDRPPGGNISDPVVRGVDVAAPAVVRIFAIYTAKISFNLCGKIITLPAKGGSYTIGWSGSGAFISSTGDILTAGHVVDDSKDSLEAGIFESPTSGADIAALLDANATCLHLAGPLTPDDIANGAVQALGIPYQATTTEPDFDVFRSTSYTGPVSLGSSVTRLLDIINGVPHEKATKLAFSEFLKEDIGVIHVNLADTPSITLDDSSMVAMQDKLTILGYPGNGDLPVDYPELGGADPTNWFTLSANVVLVSAIKKNGSGSQLIQVGGNVEHGDSGGPALDAAGHVVGIVSFGFSDSLPAGTGFFRASDSAKPLIAQANVDTHPGAFQLAWQQALADYASTSAGHWHKAASDLDALSAKYPDFRGVAPYKTYADVAATSEVVTQASQAPDSTLIAGGAAGAVGLLAVLVVVLLLVGRRRSAKAKAARVQAAAPVPMGYGYPSYPSYPSYPPTSYPPSPGQYATPNSGSPNGAAQPRGSAPGSGGPAQGQERAPAELERSAPVRGRDPGR
jgi:S1-C subfamily serine protease